MSTLHKPTMFCNVCNLLTITEKDISSKEEIGMCRECELNLYQPHREKFLSGWRPSKKFLKDYRKKIKKRVTPILKNIDNYL